MKLTMAKMVGLSVIAVLLASGVAWADDDEGLVAHYPLDGKAKDVIRGNDGVVMGATGTKDRFGKNKKAMWFDGDDDRDCEGDFIALPIDPAVVDLQQGTISVWFKMARQPYDDAFPILFLGGNANPVCEASSFSPPPTGGGGVSSVGIEVGHATVPKPDLYPKNDYKLYYTTIVDGFPFPLAPFGSGVSSCFDSDYPLDADVWYHFVAVVGPDGNTGYLNGAEMVDRHYNFTLDPRGLEYGFTDTVFFGDLFAADVFTIGKGYLGPFSADLFHGAIDDIKIFDYPLTAEEVWELYEDEDEDDDDDNDDD